MNKQFINKFHLENSLKKKGNIIAGMDEVGKGALAGPVVAGIVAFQKEDLPWIDKVNDSKLLTKKNREKISKLIVQDTIWGIGSVSNHVIDQIGIEPATALAMSLALDNLNASPSFILVDGNVKLLDVNIEYENIIKGDQKSVSIAAASIIAKVYRDNELFILDKQFPFYDFASNVGYGTKKHIDSLKAIGPSTIHRNSFMPVKELV